MRCGFREKGWNREHPKGLHHKLWSQTIRGDLASAFSWFHTRWTHWTEELCKKDLDPITFSGITMSGFHGLPMPVVGVEDLMGERRMCVCPVVDWWLVTCGWPCSGLSRCLWKMDGISTYMSTKPPQPLTVGHPETVYVTHYTHSAVAMEI